MLLILSEQRVEVTGISGRCDGAATKLLSPCANQKNLGATLLSPRGGCITCFVRIS